MVDRAATRVVPRAFHITSKPAGAICNLDCGYCFFLAKESSGQPHRNCLCSGHLTFFTHIDKPMRVMADLLRHGHDATGVRDWCARGDARQARNDPCSCGSGSTGKTCHGAPHPGRPRELAGTAAPTREGAPR